MRLPKDLAEWSIVISVTALVLVVPLNVLANLLTPRLKDWWATRSRADLERRISKLEKELVAAEQLPLLDEVFDHILFGLQRQVYYTVLATHLLFTVGWSVSWFILLSALGEHVNKLIPKTPEILLMIVIPSCVGLNYLIGTKTARSIAQYRRPRSGMYRAWLQANINKLKAKL